MQYEATSLLLLAEARHLDLQLEAAHRGRTLIAYGPDRTVGGLVAAARRRLAMALATGNERRRLTSVTPRPRRAAQPG